MTSRGTDRVTWVWLGVRRQRGAREGALVLFLLVFFPEIVLVPLQWWMK